MKYNLLTSILIVLLACCCPDCFAQGKVSRPIQQQSQTSKPKKSTPKVKVSEPDGYINGHGYVDLGLPSGTKWATCNIGAKSPEEAGDYFAWGEPRAKTSYESKNSLTYNKNSSLLQSEGVIDTISVLNKEYDAAQINWETPWKIPSKEDIEELKKECNWTWGTIGKINGFKVSGPNGKSVFLPAAGYNSGENISDASGSLYSERGHYWGATMIGTYYGYCLNFDRDDGFKWDDGHGYKFWGYTVRPILK